MDYMLGLYEKSMPDELTLEEKLICTKNAGYNFLELSIDESDMRLARLDWTKAERAELINSMLRTGVCIRTMCLSGHRKYPLGSLSEAIRQRSIEIMEKAIVLAYDLGIRIIQIAGYDVYYEESTPETERLFAENLNKSVSIASKYGVVLAFETMETEFLNTVKKCMKYVKLNDSPYLQIYPDLGNITNAALKYKTDPVDDLESGHGHIAAVHLKETIPEVFREVPFGTGHVDFAALIKKSIESGVNLFVAEFWFTGSQEWEQDLIDNRLFLEQYLRR